MMQNKCTLVNSPVPPDVCTDPDSKLKITEREHRQHKGVAEALEIDGAGVILTARTFACYLTCQRPYSPSLQNGSGKLTLFGRSDKYNYNMKKRGDGCHGRNTNE